MTGIEQLMKQIRALSYQDMMLVADELSKVLAAKQLDKLNGHMIATALLGLTLVPPDSSDQTKRDELLLGKIFSRKRQINVTRHTTGWELQVPSLPASQVIGTELRVMFPMLLDQLVTMHVLQGHK